MPRFTGNREWIAVAIISIALLAIITSAIIWLSLNAAVVILLSFAVLSGGVFGELRDTWNGERQFSLPRVFFRTFEWLSLAVAGYIVLSVIGGNTSLSP